MQLPNGLDPILLPFKYFNPTYFQRSIQKRQKERERKRLKEREKEFERKRERYGGNAKKQTEPKGRDKKIKKGGKKKC